MEILPMVPLLGTHLHFGARYEEKYIDPMKLFE